MVMNNDENAELMLIEAMGVDSVDDLAIDGGDVMRREEMVPISVEPLAVALPDGMESVRAEEDNLSGKKPSDWVMMKEKGIGKVLGASYEGYEQVVTELLMDIEARHQQRKERALSPRRPSSSGRKGSRELKGLVTSINYEARANREAKGKGKVQGGDVMVYQ